MKNYQKAEMIAKNLPTGSYAAGCPAHTSAKSSNSGFTGCYKDGGCYSGQQGCSMCEVAM